LDFADFNGEEIIEVATGSGGLHPDITNYYFVINPRTNKAVPRPLFKGAKGLEHSITSALLLSDPKDAGLPEDAGELSIIRNHKLAPSFSVYAESDDGPIEVNGRKFTRTILKWNGRHYE
jgi:hypothetical protein